MPDPVVSFTSAPFASQFATCAELLVNATAAPWEGLWIPSMWCRDASIEVTGSMSTMSISLLSTNQISEPLNQFTATIGGTVTSGDIVTLQAINANLPGGSAQVQYTVGASDTTSTIAAALAAMANASSGFQGAGISAQAAAAVITLNYPSVWPGPAGTNTASYGQRYGNWTTFSGSSNGTETVTVAGVTTPGSANGSAITALGLSGVVTPCRWLRARLTTLTGAGATISAMFNGLS